MDDAFPFRGSADVKAGRLTAAALAGPGHREVFPDVYVDADVELDLATRSLAAAVLIGEGVVLGGHSAAAVLGASCGPPGTLPEVLVHGRRRSRAGLVVRNEEVPDAERRRVRGVEVTSPVRTALDLACRGSLVDAVVAVDALAHRFGFPLSDVVRCAYDHFGRRGSGRLREVVGLADPRAGSPLQTRIRLGIVLAGLPVPEVQHPVGPYRLPLAYPEHLLAIEAIEADEADEASKLPDRDRETYLTVAGWARTLRFDEATLRDEPELVPLTVRRELRRPAPRPGPIVSSWVEEGAP